MNCGQSARVRDYHPCNSGSAHRTGAHSSLPGRERPSRQDACCTHGIAGGIAATQFRRHYGQAQTKIFCRSTGRDGLQLCANGEHFQGCFGADASGGVTERGFRSIPNARAADLPTPSTALEVTTVRRRSLSRLRLSFRYLLVARRVLFFHWNSKGYASINRPHLPPPRGQTRPTPPASTEKTSLPLGCKTAFITVF